MSAARGCAFRRSRPLIPTDRDQLFRLIATLIPVLHRDLGGGDAAVPPAAGREIPARRREPGLSGRERDRDRDAQGHGGRTADAAPLGRTARRLRSRELPGHEPRQHREPGGAARQQDRGVRHG
jgi:hypothetical protein